MAWTTFLTWVAQTLIVMALVFVGSGLVVGVIKAIRGEK